MSEDFCNFIGVNTQEKRELAFKLTLLLTKINCNCGEYRIRTDHLFTASEAL